MRVTVAIAFLALVLGNVPCLASQSEPPAPIAFVDPSVTAATNPHFSGKYCVECHLNVPKSIDNLQLRFVDDFFQTCRCHGYEPGTYIHPVNIVPSPAKQALIPADFPLQDGKISCATCHDIALQCREDDTAQKNNKTFLRGAPYANRTGLCIRCHKQGTYKAFDPHEQLDEEGRVIQEKCLYCHSEVPDVEHSTFGLRRTRRTLLTKTVKLIGDLEVLCNRCHFNQSRFHPINADHFRVPPKRILENMRRSEKKLGVILPLDYDGEITCPTCHNPHERGVIPSGKASAKGAGEKYRLRVPGAPTRMCLACHSK